MRITKICSFRNLPSLSIASDPVFDSIFLSKIKTVKLMSMQLLDTIQKNISYISVFPTFLPNKLLEDLLAFFRLQITEVLIWLNEIWAKSEFPEVVWGCHSHMLWNHTQGFTELIRLGFQLCENMQLFQSFKTSQTSPPSLMVDAGILPSITILLGTFPKLRARAKLFSILKEGIWEFRFWPFFR